MPPDQGKNYHLHNYGSKCQFHILCLGEYGGRLYWFFLPLLICHCTSSLTCEAASIATDLIGNILELAHLDLHIISDFDPQVEPQVCINISKAINEMHFYRRRSRKANMW